MAHLSISLLGTFTVTLDGREARGFNSDKTRALLAYLALEGVRPQRREVLAALLWPEQPGERARGSLSQSLYNLRKTLKEREAREPFLITTPQTVAFNPDCGCWLDVRRFDDLLSACERHAHPRPETCPECGVRLGQAAALYRGDFLEGFSISGAYEFDEWLMLQRERTCQNALIALASLAAYHEWSGETVRALDYARRAVRLDSLWETGQRGLMRLLALSGQREAALEVFTGYRKRLMNELGVEPEGKTRSLYERLCRERDQPPVLDDLPAHLTPFVGRQGELVELGALLCDSDTRLVTVLGEGGSGKSRLALQAAQGLRYHFPDGVYLVPLSALGSEEGLAPAVAEALGFTFREGADPETQLADYLRAKQLLLILDSFEVVLGGARWLSELLRAAPQVKALVSSRARLKLKGERIFPLGGMGSPELDAFPQNNFDPHEYSALALFLAGMERRGGKFDWKADDWREAAHVCRLVGGMPLGLLLASAWVGTYTLSEIADEIERSLDFLSADWNDAPERQRSLRATLDYSWRLLSDGERALFGKLSVFRGGFTRQAAWGVADADPLVLQGLVDKTMLELRPPGRYAMHDLLRQFGEEKLAEDLQIDKAARGAHAIYYLGKLPDWGAGLKGTRQVDVLAQMDMESGNLGAAWAWAAENQMVDLLAGGMGGLFLFAALRARFREGQLACQYVLDHLASNSDPEVLRTLVRANTWKSHFMRLMGKHEEAARILAQNLADLDGPVLRGTNTRAERAFLLLELGSAALPTDRPAARRYYEESLGLYADNGNPWGQARALSGLGLVAHHAGTFEEAVQYYQHSLALYEGLGDPKATAGVLIDLGQNSLRMGLLEQGEAYVQSGVTVYEKIGDRAGQADSLLQLSRMCFWSGSFIRGKSLMTQARPIFQELGLIENYTFTLVGEAIPLVLLGENQAARLRAREGGEVARANSFLRFHAISYWVLGMADLADGEMHSAHAYLDQSVDIYRTIKQNDELGWALAALAYADLGMGYTAEFINHICESLQIGGIVRGLFPLMLAIPAVALYMVQRSQMSPVQASREGLERAVELYALTRRYPTAANAPWFEAAAGKTIAVAAASLPDAFVERAKARGQAGDLFAAAQELLGEFCSDSAK